MKLLLLMKMAAILSFLTTTANANILDIKSNNTLPKSYQVGWLNSSTLWQVENATESIYNRDPLAVVHQIFPADHSGKAVTSQIQSGRMMLSHLINMVCQLSIDIFIQSSVGMNDYKNLVTGIPVKAAVNHDLFTGQNGKLGLSILLKQTFHSFDGKTAEEFDDYEIPMPRAFWLCFTGLFGYIGLKGKYWWQRYSWKINDKHYQSSYAKIFQKL